jgi:hypothetical protein
MGDRRSVFWSVARAVWGDGGPPLLGASAVTTPRSAAVGGAAAYVLTATAAGLPFVAVVRAGIAGAALTPAAVLGPREDRDPTRFVGRALAGCAFVWIASGVPLGGTGGLVVTAALLAVRSVLPGALESGDVRLALLIDLGLGARALAALGLGLGLAASAALAGSSRAASQRRAAPVVLAPFLAIGAIVALALS